MSLQALKNWFAVSIVLLTFAYILLGRWDYMLSQADPEPTIDGVKRFPSMYRFPPEAKVGAKASPTDSDPATAVAAKDEETG